MAGAPAPPLNAANPLAEADPAGAEDRDLVARARAGDGDAIERLVRRHQRWIYNIAVRMHPRSVPADLRLLVDEARITCTAGMLLCLDRAQRLAYVLGEILGVSDAVGAELLEISRENFRQRLARARRDLHSFMNDRCGLVNPANPCRCARKTRGFMAAGHVDPTGLLFAREHVQQVRDVAAAASDALATVDAQCAGIFRRHPFSDAPDLVPALRGLIHGEDFRRATGLA